MNSFVNILIYIGIGLGASAILLFINLVFFSDVKEFFVEDGKKFETSRTELLKGGIVGSFETLIAGTLAASQLFELGWLKAFGTSFGFVVILYIIFGIIVHFLRSPEYYILDDPALTVVYLFGFSIASGVLLTLFLAKLGIIK